MTSLKKNTYRGIKLGDTVAVYYSFTREKIEGSEKPNGVFLTRKVYSAKPSRYGVVADIHCHNGYAARITFSDGSNAELGLGTHFKIEGQLND